MSEQNLERSNRAACFSLPTELVESGEAGKLLAFMEFTPIRTECIGYGGIYEYVGLSPLFDEVEDGLMWPNIRLDVKTNPKTGEIISVDIIKN